MMVVNGHSVSYVPHVGLFDGSSGALVRSFDNPNPTNDQFGLFVGSLGNRVVVGGGYGPGNNVYLFDGLTGSLLTTIQEPSANDGFGDAGAIVGNNILVGAPYANNNSGAAYLYDGSTGSLLQTFLPPSPGNNGFGESVAAAGNNVLIGATGNVYLFQGASVPEPSTLALLGAGAIGLAVRALGGGLATGHSRTRGAPAAIDHRYQGNWETFQLTR